MPGKLFTPDRLDVLVGTTVSWKNDDAVNHTATAENDAFASGYIPPGGSYSFTFTQQGRVRVPLHDPQADARRGGRLRARALRPGGARHRRAPRRLRRSRAGRDGVGDAPRQAEPSRSSSRATTEASRCGSRSGRRRPTGRSRRGSRARGSASRSSRSCMRPAAGGRCAWRRHPRGRARQVVVQSYDRERFGWRTVTGGTLDREVARRVPHPRRISSGCARSSGGRRAGPTRRRPVPLGRRRPCGTRGLTNPPFEACRSAEPAQGEAMGASSGWNLVSRTALGPMQKSDVRVGSSAMPGRRRPARRVGRARPLSGRGAVAAPPRPSASEIGCLLGHRSSFYAGSGAPRSCEVLPVGYQDGYKAAGWTRIV